MNLEMIEIRYYSNSENQLRKKVDLSGNETEGELKNNTERTGHGVVMNHMRLIGRKIEISS